MKIAVAGKGGAGKTTVAGTLARAWAQGGHRVLALDADANPMLGIALGLGPEGTEELISARQALDAGELEHESTAEGVVETFGADAPDDVRVVVVNRIENYGSGCQCCGLNPESLVQDLDGDDRIILCDLEAGIGTVSRIQEGQLDIVLVVCEPSAKSIDVARRAVRVATNRARVMVLANRITSSEDLEAIRSAVGDVEVLALSEDAAITRADQEGLAPIDVDPDAPAVRALIEFADRLAGLAVPA